MKVHVILCLLLAALLASMGGCGTAPYTNRKQLLLLSEGQEVQLGLQSWNDVVKGERMSTRQDWVNMVEQVGRRIAAVADAPADYQWEFRVIAEPTVNAFCLPGGKVAFYEGIMPVCENANGVAVVMGHEVSHALARHGGERISQTMLTQMGQEAVTTLIGTDSPVLQQSISAALGLGAQVGILLPFSRTQESEADHIGLILMAKAGYDPREAPRFWQRMNALSGGAATPEFLSTHPNPETRIRQLEEWMPEALQYYNP